MSLEANTSSTTTFSLHTTSSEQGLHVPYMLIGTLYFFGHSTQRLAVQDQGLNLACSGEGAKS